MSNIPLSSLYLPGVTVFQTRAAAQAAIPNLPAFDPSQPPKNWTMAQPDGDPDAPFTIHHLQDAGGVAKYVTSFIANSQVPVLNIPPDAPVATNAPVYPASVAIPMTYPLPAGDTVFDGPFGLQLSDGAASVDPTSGSILSVVTDIRNRLIAKGF